MGVKCLGNQLFHKIELRNWGFRIRSESVRPLEVEMPIQQPVFTVHMLSFTVFLLMLTLELHLSHIYLRS